MNEKDLELEELNLEEIMKEFSENPVAAPEAATESDDLGDTRDLPDLTALVAEKEQEEPETGAEEAAQTQEAPAEAPEEAPAPVAELDDTVRLDNLEGITGTAPAYASILEDKTERFEPVGAVRIGDEEGEDEDDLEIPVPAPIVFRPRQRLRELKRELIAGPEKRYYELSEKGVGKLQLAMLVCLAVVAVCAGAGAMHTMGLVPENRIKLLVFSQVLVMLIGALAGCHQMIDGIGDLFRGRFTLNTMLAVTCLASAADAYLCLQEQRVPLCAAFTLEVMMAVWNLMGRPISAPTPPAR